MRTTALFSCAALLAGMAAMAPGGHFAAAAAADTPAEGKPFTLKHHATGTISKFNYYRVMQAPMSPQKPAHITKEPAYKNSPLYGTLTFGSDDRIPITFALDEDEKGATFYVDSNGNGDLTDDAPPTLWRRQEQPPERRGIAKIWLTYWYDGKATASYGPGKTEEIGVKFYIYSKADLARNKMEPVLLYYRDYYRAGAVEIDGKAYQAALIDDDSDGRYDSPPRSDLRFKGDTLLIDLDGSGKFERSAEAFAVNEPFLVGEKVYEVARIGPAGDALTFRPSDRPATTVRRPVRLPQIGQEPPAIALDATRSLADLKGKVVLIDFWATWCGPCIAELPHVRAAYKRFHKDGFEIVSVSLDDPADAAKVAEFVKKNDMPWLQVHDTAREIGKRYGVTAIPVTYLLGRDGKIIAANLRGEELEAAVAKAVR